MSEPEVAAQVESTDPGPAGTEFAVQFLDILEQLFADKANLCDLGPQDAREPVEVPMTDVTIQLETLGLDLEDAAAFLRTEGFQRHFRLKGEALVRKDQAVEAEDIDDLGSDHSDLDSENIRRTLRLVEAPTGHELPTYVLGAADFSNIHIYGKVNAVLGYVDLLTASAGRVEIDYAESELSVAILGQDAIPLTLTKQRFYGGRLMASSAIQSMPSAAIPWALGWNNAYQVDIKACYAQILAHIAPAGSPIFEYSENSDLWRQDAAEHYGCTRKAAKQLYNSMLNGGAEYGWRRLHGLTSKTPFPHARDFERQAQAILNDLEDEHPGTLETCTDHRGEGHSNDPRRTLLSKLCQGDERRAIDVMRRVCQRYGVPLSLKHDAVVGSDLIGDKPYVWLRLIERALAKHLKWRCRVEMEKVERPTEPSTGSFSKWFGATRFSAGVMEQRLARWRQLALRKLPDLSRGGVLERLKREQDEKLQRKGKYHAPATDEDIRTALQLSQECIQRCVASMRVWAMNLFFAQLVAGGGEVVEFRFKDNKCKIIEEYDIVVSPS